MANQFNALEIFKIAMNVEKEGKEFYKKCVEVNSEPEVKELFKRLETDEEEHYQYFKELLEEFDKADRSITRDYLYNEQVNNYLKTLVDTKVFPKDETVTDDIARNLKEALEVGIKAEKNSLLLYNELIGVEKNEKTIEALKKLINEEKEHLVELKNLHETM